VARPTAQAAWRRRNEISGGDRERGQCHLAVGLSATSPLRGIFRGPPILERNGIHVLRDDLDISINQSRAGERLTDALGGLRGTVREPPRRADAVRPREAETFRNRDPAHARCRGSSRSGSRGGIYPQIARPPARCATAIPRSASARQSRCSALTIRATRHGVARSSPLEAPVTAPIRRSAVHCASLQARWRGLGISFLL